MPIGIPRHCKDYNSRAKEYSLLNLKPKLKLSIISKLRVVLIVKSKVEYKRGNSHNDIVHDVIYK